LDLGDGSRVNPQIELYDSAGDTYELRHSGGVRKWVDEAVFRSRGDKPDLRGHEFTKIRIRSDVPFICERISWEDHDPK